VLAHGGHLGLHCVHLEQQHRLGGLFHLIDGVVEAVDQIFDVAAVKRCDEGAAHQQRHFARDAVGHLFEVIDLGGRVIDAGTAL
jgi:hypothetical protein